jgi:hypothetical protein
MKDKINNENLTLNLNKNFMPYTEIFEWKKINHT